MMTFTSLITVLTLALVSKNITCSKTTDIDFITDFTNRDVSKSFILVGFLCWNTDEKCDLLARLSQNNIISSVFDVNTSESIDYHHLYENVLYLVDLDCQKSMDVIAFANDKNLFAVPNKWLMITTRKDFIQKDYFAKYNFSVDSNIVITFKNDVSHYDLYEIYKYHKKADTVKQTYITQWTRREGFKNTKTYVSSELRRDIGGTTLKASFVILNNDTFNHLTDYRFKHIDTLTKANFVFTNHLFDYVNATRGYIFVPTWGYYDKKAKMYTGMIGTMQRDEAELGGTSILFTSDRVRVIEYVEMSARVRAKFIFRPPPLSYVTNIFTLPFSRGVWLSSFGLCAVVSIFLYFAVSVEMQGSRTAPETNVLQPSLLDSVMLTIGAVAQQGATSEPKSGSGRTVMIVTFTALMFLYVSYSANIVALLQSSSTNIKTLADLLHSRLELGHEDTEYNHFYFKTATEPIRKAIYEKKIAPKGRKPSVMTLSEGVARLRKGFFAFHTESSSVYKLIDDTFYESEKCGLQGIEYFQVVDPYYTLKKNSSYREIFTLGWRKLHESGVQARENQRFYTQKPECYSTGGNFVSVGLIDSYPAFLVLGSGMGVSMFLFFVEKITYMRLNHRNIS